MGLVVFTTTVSAIPPTMRVGAPLHAATAMSTTQVETSFVITRLPRVAT
jgi:hypothetical protein